MCSAVGLWGADTCLKVPSGDWSLHPKFCHVNKVKKKEGDPQCSVASKYKAKQAKKLVASGEWFMKEQRNKWLHYHERLCHRWYQTAPESRGRTMAQRQEAGGWDELRKPCSHKKANEILWVNTKYKLLNKYINIRMQWKQHQLWVGADWDVNNQQEMAL